MKILAFLIAVIAERVFKSDWLNLKNRLYDVYRCHKREKKDRSSILLQSLLISGEDHRFFAHGGFDIIAIFRALWRGTILGKREGASTIEMQIVRVLTGCYERNLKRKIREVALATLLTRVVPKSELPSVYLLIGYYGWKMNGIKEACKRLSLDPRLIRLEDAALLIARLKYPQPRCTSAIRISQIERRARHLINLHRKHLRLRIYEGLSTQVDYATI